MVDTSTRVECLDDYLPDKGGIAVQGSTGAPFKPRCRVPQVSILRPGISRMTIPQFCLITSGHHRFTIAQRSTAAQSTISRKGAA